MSTALTMFDPKVGVPAHIAAFFENDGGSNIESRTGVPSLSPGGKVWTISLNGEKVPLMKRTPDGDVEPVNVMRAVILEFAKRRGRAYYPGAYDPDNAGAPLCWSADGVTPDASVVDKQSAKCGDCPMSAKGSKVGDNGKAQVACSQHRMLVVVPSNKLDFEPLRLKIAMTSDWDKESPDQATQGWFAFQNYIEWLKTKGVNHTAAVVTKMKFDSKAAYPKIFFAADRWLTAEELAQVNPLTKDEAVLQLLNNTYTPAGADGVKVADQPVGNAVRGATSTTGGDQSIASTSDDDDDGEIILGGLGAPAAVLVQEPAQAAVASPRAAKTSTAAAAKAAVAATIAEPVAATSVVDASLGDLLADWGGD